ncbi:hypothetical protein ACFY0N_37470 [Streptomyces vinaceus]|uniref:hypothetical protein n=1 Tax=Streptomyces vinaceus TaxID=1960 RepID=UPI0036B60BAE
MFARLGMVGAGLGLTGPEGRARIVLTLIDLPLAIEDCAAALLVRASRPGLYRALPRVDAACELPQSLAPPGDEVVAAQPCRPDSVRRDVAVRLQLVGRLCVDRRLRQLLRGRQISVGGVGEIQPAAVSGSSSGPVDPVAGPGFVVFGVLRCQTGCVLAGTFRGLTPTKKGVRPSV